MITFDEFNLEGLGTGSPFAGAYAVSYTHLTLPTKA